MDEIIIITTVDRPGPSAARLDYELSLPLEVISNILYIVRTGSLGDWARSELIAKAEKSLGEISAILARCSQASEPLSPP